MKPVTLIGAILIIAGVLFLAYQGITYTSREQVAQIGDLQLTADKQKTVIFPPYVGGIALVAGLVLVVVGRMGGPK